MTLTPHLASDSAACCWIPLFALRSELARRPELASLPVALVAPDTARPPRLCPALKLCEPDPVHYDEQFARLVAALVTVSPVVEPVELGRVFVGTDGLEGLYGEPEGIVEAILMRSAECGMRNVLNAECGMRNAECKGKRREANDPSLKFRTPHSAFRIGWGRGKFVSWVAASRAKPGGSVIVRPGEERKFLASQRLAVLPLDPDTHRRLLQLGVKTLGALVALPEEAVVSQFGRAGRRLWRLAAGLVAEPVVGRVVPEPIVAALTFFTPVGERDLLAHALDKLVDRALGDPRRSGWRVQVVRVHAELEHGASWLVAATLKDPAATRERIAAPLKTQLERSPPAGAVERLVVEFTAFAPGTAELQLFARDAGAAARAGRRRALQSAAREIALRIRRPMLYHVIEVQPWSRLPERRYALIDFEP